MRPFLFAAAAFLLQGCCCCPFGGGGGGGGGSRSGASPVEEWAAEEFAEKLIETSTGEQVELDVHGDKGLTIKTEDGELTTWADGRVPDGFPLPIIDGATVTAATRLIAKDSGTSYNVIMTTSKSPQDAVSWYAKECKGSGWSVITIGDMVEAAGQAEAEAELPISDAGMIQIEKGEISGQVYGATGDEGTEVVILLAKQDAG